MGIPAYQAVGTVTKGITAITVPWPTHAVNDIGILLIESYTGQAANLTTANGFAAITTGYADLGTRLTGYWCRATSAAMASPVVTDPGDHATGFILTVRGCRAVGNPWSVAPIWETQAANTAISFSSLTTDKANTLMVYGLGIANVLAASMSSWTNANLASITERADDGNGIGSNNGGIACATGLKLSIGATGATTATCSASRATAHLILGLVGETGGSQAIWCA